MKFNVVVEIEDMYEEELLDARFKNDLKQSIISEYVKNLKFEDSKYFVNIREVILDEAKKYIHQMVDQQLDNVLNIIARKKAIVEATPAALNLSEQIDQALARKFGGK